VNEPLDKAMSNERSKILKDLEPMFREAREKGLLFRSRYQELLFTPDQLEEQQRNGRFVWGPVNWKLEHPSVERERRKGALRNAQMAVDNFTL
jgi:hypothetical protein